MTPLPMFRIIPLMSGRVSGGVLALLLLVVSGCASARDHYLDGLRTVRQLDTPSPAQVTAAKMSLDKAITRAKKELESGRKSLPSKYDGTAYLIPLARIAKGKLYKRFQQTPELERECWLAIRDAEAYLGGHIAKMQNTVTDEEGNATKSVQGIHKSMGASVFFRREKIRRHVFALLLDTYREAGERNLEALMKAQIGFSDAYLRSPVAHGEEEFIRQVENSDWLQRYDQGTSKVRYNITSTFLILAQAASTAASAAQKQNLEQQAIADPSKRAYVEERKRAIDERERKNLEQFKKAQEKLKKNFQREQKGIETAYANTVIDSLASNFDLVGVSEEMQRLDKFVVLKKKKKDFDDYVLKNGFDQKAADALIDLRTSLDELTREMQRERDGS